MPKNSSTTMEPVESKETQLEEKPGTLQYRVLHGDLCRSFIRLPMTILSIHLLSNGITSYSVLISNWANGQQHLISYSALIRDWMIVFYPSFSKYGRSSSKLPYMDIDNHIPNF
ncbi:hypothetical protein T11_107 [Trichinella zimbabwensis]|uniref:Uncharacterized protein n=1 Tax=Trichinella zimbabwensis TaxID=268475 RepID=A0A0V1HSV5_9BILA|nr:hypothetical protein T11_107 [Trichinella zimbabwensis]